MRNIISRIENKTNVVARVNVAENEAGLIRSIRKLAVKLEGFSVSSLDVKNSKTLEELHPNAKINNPKAILAKLIISL